MRGLIRQIRNRAKVVDVGTCAERLHARTLDRMTTTTTSVHGRPCLDAAIGSIAENNLDTTREHARGAYGNDPLAELLTSETDEVAAEWIASGIVPCRCADYVDSVNVAALGARLVPFLPAAIERFGSLESAVDHLVALMAADADEARDY